VSGRGGAGPWLWLLRYDIARTCETGLTCFLRFACSGYVWLGISGLLGYFSAVSPSARLHAILPPFLSVYMAMIFSHAPIIFPAVLGKPIEFQPVFYTHLVLLHLSLLLRVGGDLLVDLPARQWGGLLNVVAILLFIASTGWAVVKSARRF
jgi:hypothetical protein